MKAMTNTQWLKGNGKMDGNDIAYIYPKAKLALIGKFKNNIMFSAHNSSK